MPQNILFIMCDQLRWDYLSCAGHPHLQTPNIDWLAKTGVRFDKAFVQSPVCGPSRASMYTGRYQSTLGVRTNGYPLRRDELGLGDYLGELDMRTAVVGKTHLIIDGPARPDGELGFEPFDRDDGIHPTKAWRKRPESFQYNAYLRQHGYEGENPWQTHANSSVDPEGNLHNGWFNHSARWPANVAEEHSETAYATNRAIDFMQTAGVRPWCLHLSYIKPHWPYIAPAPYHECYTTAQIVPVNRTQAERETPLHPIYAGMQRYASGEGFVRDEVRETVIPAYMGLIKQIDDHLGRLFDWMRANDLLDNTVIVFSSDHGDYLGDHWLTDKFWLHEEAVRVPLIIRDPSVSAETTRGTVCTELVEMVDLLPTLVELSGGTPNEERLEGRSLVPFLHGGSVDQWRDFVVCEADYSPITVRHHLDLAVDDARATMLRTQRWKYILHETFEPELYDLENDPHEQHNLGSDPAHATIRAVLNEALFRWFRQRKLRFTRTNAFTIERSTPGYYEAQSGVYIGYW